MTNRILHPTYVSPAAASILFPVLVVDSETICVKDFNKQPQRLASAEYTPT